MHHAALCSVAVHNYGMTVIEHAEMNQVEGIGVRRAHRGDCRRTIDLLEARVNIARLIAMLRNSGIRPYHGRRWSFCSHVRRVLEEDIGLMGLHPQTAKLD